MNDKQKDIALEMAVSVCQWLASLSDSEKARCVNRSRELIAAFDSAADAPKRKPTTADISAPQQDAKSGFGWYRIRCHEFGWTSDGWVRGNRGHGYTKKEADAFYAGLVATGNVPEVGE